MVAGVASSRCLGSRHTRMVTQVTEVNPQEPTLVPSMRSALPGRAGRRALAVYIPSPPTQPAPAMIPKPGPDESRPRQESGPTVLIVEDEDAVRGAIRRLLQDEGYTVLEAQNGASALEVLNTAGATGVALVLTDLRMPVMDGRQLAAALARLRPSLPVVLMSGFTAQLMDMRLVSPHFVFLAKPFKNHDLLATVKGQLKRAV